MVSLMPSIISRPLLISSQRLRLLTRFKTELQGVRALLHDYSADLSYVSYLSDVVYLIKFHFVWNEDRKDLNSDRLPAKHEAIMERSIRKGDVEMCFWVQENV